ncbi:hypothetical protein N7520_004042 [Penicillium odoratum]|uniref:uncharacterized protein n=1 Tax=Penicillium odoratum TaxID=1167516 RepID=UPI0025484964|nr:uncharacterized protein N7520_004042 [Penicillium odoratum]KAJ5769483.1 hypothetical protein N7520_004042 [Penicillium odoratum]
MAASPDTNWLAKIEGKSFQNVSIDSANGDAINTEEFLQAARSLVTLFDILGATTFNRVIADLNTNIEKVQKRKDAAPAESVTLQDLVRNELKSGQHKATEGLLWLVRGLDFTVQALRHNLNNPSAQLTVSFKEAYGDTLKPHHNMIVKGVFNAAMGFCPYRTTFIRKVDDKNAKAAADEKEQVDPEVEARVLAGLNKEVEALEKVVNILKTFQASPEAQWK